MQKIFVFRISKGNTSGNPIGKCPIDYSRIKRIIQELPDTSITPIDYKNNGHLDFVFQEFWNNGTLRQGWGIKDLDLNQSVKEWIENYMLSGKIYWNSNINCNEAKGRRNILIRMREIKIGDVLLIPKTSSRTKYNDYSSFTACQVKGEYFFDYPTKYQDFGHCLKVTNLKEFNYSSKTLNSSDFGTPYICAIMEVKSHHSRFNKIRNFVDNEFNKKPSP